MLKDLLMYNLLYLQYTIAIYINVPNQCFKIGQLDCFDTNI